jgi:replicative DNA helicase
MNLNETKKLDLKNENEKKYYIDAFITKMCEKKEFIDFNWGDEFVGDRAMLLKKLSQRKKDVPSIQYLKETYKFEPQETEYTTTDLKEKLNKIFYTESTNKLFKEVMTARQTGTDSRDALECLTSVSKKLDKIKAIITNAQVVDLVDDRGKVVDEYKKLLSGQTFVKTGFSYIDKICKPRLGSMLLLVGQTGAGKSLLMTLMQKHALNNGVKTLYISLEMTLIEVINRLLASQGKIDLDKLDTCALSAEDYEKEIENLTKTNTYILTMDGDGKLDLPTIERYIADIKPEVVFLDYMTIIPGVDTSWNASTSISAELKRIALQYKLFMVTAAQADTSSMQAGEIPEMWNTRGNKSYGHDVNYFIGFASERTLMDPGEFVFRFSIRKNRGGGLSDFTYRIRPANGQLTDVTGME